MRKPTSGPAGPSQRQLRVGEQVRHALAEVLARGDVQDPALAGMIISVLEVRMSPDLRHGTVLVMPLGGKGEKEAVEALNLNAKPIRHEVSRRLRELKFSPELKFRVDDRYDETQRIDKIFHQDRVKRDLIANTDDQNSKEADPE